MQSVASSSASQSREHCNQHATRNLTLPGKCASMVMGSLKHCNKSLLPEVFGLFEFTPRIVAQCMAKNE
eukprot:753611-Amphidinium_carterae.2